MEILRTIELFNDAFNYHDVDAVMKLMTDDVVFENTSGGRFEGHETVRAVLTRAFGLMATGWFETEEMFAIGDRCVARWTYALDKNDPQSNKVRGVDIYRVRNSRVAEKHSYVKSEDFVRQLGLQLSNT